MEIIMKFNKAKKEIIKESNGGKDTVIIDNRSVDGDDLKDQVLYELGGNGYYVKEWRKVKDKIDFATFLRIAVDEIKGR